MLSGAGAIGVATADGLYALLAVLGGAALAGLISPISGPLRRWVSGPRGRLITVLVSSAIIVILAGIMVTGG